ncbi:TRAP transporter small permease subunit [Aquibium sp. A9E412]|uniref:TRAP transporter small permease subunit n=1 Tax=Aquibium sp. A9E412 TaxID=2976767 RepID=UPI0025AF77D1|nr:TRAP transporter small permease subunit [Aquibium sp. A9E412]MDN2567123.1 TRAP transporter small permease subunit [Aquibium sp. A9E412]
MKLIDRLSSGFAILSGLMVFALIAVMIFEVVSRYVFGSPTLWAGDLTYMLGGALFMGAAAYCLKQDGHVSIDFIVLMLPDRLRAGILAVLLLGLALPTFTAVSYVAVREALRAYERGSVDPVSAFAPQLWPFYSALAAGMVLLTAQTLVTALRSILVAAGRHG